MFGFWYVNVSWTKRVLFYESSHHKISSTPAKFKTIALDDLECHKQTYCYNSGDGRSRREANSRDKYYFPADHFKKTHKKANLLTT